MTPIVITMEDELVHTAEHPYCSDETCPCHAERVKSSHWQVQAAYQETLEVWDTIESQPDYDTSAKKER